MMSETPEPLLPADAQPEARAVHLIVPVNVSGWALAACYAGLIGLCLPFAGLLFAIPGLVCGIIAYQRQRQTPGPASGQFRTLLGLIFSTIAILLWGGASIYLLLDWAKLLG
jgi:hypothetical protein